MVNPYDVEGTADAIYAAYIMEPAERERRMKTLRAEVKRNDVRKWVDWFVGSGVDFEENQPLVHEDSFIA
jgi:trehalose 6-phosphate synthase/phosphatase